MNILKETTEFETLIQPLSIMINLIYDREIKYLIPAHFSKYGDISLINSGALDEINTIIKTNVKHCLTMVSKTYMKKLNHIFNNDGIIYYIYTSMYNSITTDIEKLISSN